MWGRYKKSHFQGRQQMQEGLTRSWSHGCPVAALCLEPRSVWRCPLRRPTGLPHSSFTRIEPWTTWGPTSLTLAWESVPRPQAGRKLQAWMATSTLYDPTRKRALGSLCESPEPTSNRIRAGECVSWLPITTLTWTCAACFKTGHCVFHREKRLYFEI